MWHLRRVHDGKVFNAAHARAGDCEGDAHHLVRLQLAVLGLRSDRYQMWDCTQTSTLRAYDGRGW